MAKKLGNILFLHNLIIADAPCTVQLPEKSADKHERKEFLHNLVTAFIRTFVFDVQESDDLVEQVDRLDRLNREGYCCRVCGQKYQGDAWRVR